MRSRFAYAGFLTGEEVLQCQAEIESIPPARRNSDMELAGVVQNGVIIPENGAALPEGARVRIILEPVEGTIKQASGAASPLGEILLKHAGKAQGLPEDLAEQHDHYLHGTPKR
jgi:hypothetical protein